jgi:hypothetical protein
MVLLISSAPTVVAAPVNKRGTPEVLSPDESRAVVVLAQLRSILLAAGNDKNAINNFRKAFEEREKSRDKPESETEVIPVEKPGEEIRFALTVIPQRMAIIVASFPYKRQVEEHRKKLGLSSTVDVLKESISTGEGDGTALPTFRFLGVSVERRTLDASGKEWTAWQPFDVGKDFVPIFLMCLRCSESPDPSLGDLSFPGLVMPRPKQMRDDQYPKVENELDNLKKTLKELNRIGESPKKGSHVADPFDPFGGEEKDSPEKDKETPQDPKGLVPEHCLLRVIDVTVEPGKTYQYRLRVRMANPNYGRKDVADPGAAKEKELQAENWYQVSQTVVMPPEVVYYAVDQKALGEPFIKIRRGPFDPEEVRGEKRPYRGINANVEPGPSQTVFQIHQWLEAIGPKKDFLIGEWSALERVLVYRGEYVARDERVDLPYWRITREKFVLAKGPDGKGLPVHFGQEGAETLLVDFQGGDMAYDKVDGNKGGKPEMRRVQDKASREVVLLSPDGKLRVSNSATDERDFERLNRHRSWLERVKEVKEDKPDK